MVKSITIIKLGGSAITIKDELETLKSDALRQTAICIRQCWESGASLVVVHGAGSFGHHHAKEFEINKGMSSALDEEERKKKILGFSLTRQSVQKLNQLVIKALVDIGVPAVACSPGCSWRTSKREPVDWPKETISRLLEKNLIPVLHGDCCIDESSGICVLSGDTVIKTLCLSFDVRRAVFLTDVEGVFDRPPTEPDAQLLKMILVKDDGTVEQKIGTSQPKNDVTGGILLKLNTAINIVHQTRDRCQVFVCAIDSCDASHIISAPEVDIENVQCTKICLST